MPPLVPPPMAASAPIPEPEPIVRREPPMGMKPPAFSYDREAWRRIVEGDADLARVVSVLTDYGDQYVDELAKEYLAVGDKRRLPEIVDGIIGRAGKNVAPPLSNAAPASDIKPRNPVRAPNAAAARPDRQPRPLPAAKVKVAEQLPDPAPQPAAPVTPEIVSAPVPPPIVVEPAPDAAARNKTIVSADEELTAMLGRLSPDAATPSKN